MDDEMQQVIAANLRALDAGICTVANAYDLKCGDPATYVIAAGDVTEPVCARHLVAELDNALTVYAQAHVLLYDTAERIGYQTSLGDTQ